MLSMIIRSCGRASGSGSRMIVPFSSLEKVPGFFEIDFRSSYLVMHQ